MDKLKVLIIDDSSDDALLLERQLKRDNFDCEVQVADSRTSLHTALDSMPHLDVVFCDYTMPELGFVEANRIVRGKYNLVPMILVTGTISEEMAADALRSGVQDFLIKGKFTRLKSIVERELRTARARRMHHQAENKISRLARMLDKAQVAIIAFDLDFTISFWNTGAAELYGWTESEIAFNKLDELLFSHAPAEHSQAFETTLRDGKWQGELTQITRDSQPRIVQCTWTVLENELEETAGMLMTCIDVTSGKEREEYFLRNQRVQTMGLLASGMAHDLNNLLSPILLASNLLKTRTDDEQALKLLHTVEQCVNRSTNLIKQALHFTKGQGHRKKIVRVRFLLEEFVQLIRRTFPKKIEINLKVQKKNMPKMLCNPTQFEQVMMNLCVNARDVMPRGGKLEITAESVHFEPNQTDPQELKELAKGDYVVVRVADSGPGIPTSVRPSLFEPFQTSKAPEEGSGLGLYTVKNIMTEYHGAVTVANNEDGGAIFSLYFPAEIVHQDHSQAAEKEQLAGRREVILLVDKNEDFLHELQNKLEQENYVVLTATDGPAAVAMYAQFKTSIRILVTTFNLRRMDGDALVQALRSLNPELPVVLMSADPKKVELGDLGKIERIRFIKKPFETTQLLREVRHQLNAAN